MDEKQDSSEQEPDIIEWENKQADKRLATAVLLGVFLALVCMGVIANVAISEHTGGRALPFRYPPGEIFAILTLASSILSFILYGAARPFLKQQAREFALAFWGTGFSTLLVYMYLIMRWHLRI